MKPITSVGVFKIDTRIFDDKSLYISNDSPTLEYNNGALVNNAHWGQLKLMGVETMFMSDYYIKSIHKKPVVVYAGAASGEHFELLSQMFKDVIWHLYDPAPFTVKATDKLIIHNEFFTDDIAHDLRSKAVERDWDLFFMSDIRIVPPHDDANVKAKMKEEQVDLDLVHQEKWHNILKPIVSLLKFRIPFIISDVDGDFEYLPGKIMIQPFAPKLSNEVRLIVTEHNKRVKFSSRWFVQVMHYHNCVVRPYHRFKTITDNGEGLFFPSLRNDYDSMWISLMCKKYIGWSRINNNDSTTISDSDIERFAKIFIEKMEKVCKFIGNDYPCLELKRSKAFMETIQEIDYIVNYSVKKYYLPSVEKYNRIKNQLDKTITSNIEYR